MSFYGQVLYEFKKLFTHIQLKNIKDYNIPESFKDEITPIEADGDWDTLHIEAGNHWVQFDADVDNNKMMVYHNAPNQESEEKYNNFGLDIESDSQVPDELQFGQDLYFRSGRRDETGHLIVDNTKTVKMPNYNLIINDVEAGPKSADNNFTFNSNELILLSTTENNTGINIEHKDNIDQKENEEVNDKEYKSHYAIYDTDKRIDISSIEIVSDELRNELEGLTDENDLAKIKQLTTYDIIRVPIITYDNAGHGLSYQYNYFKMPFSKMQIENEQAADNINALKEYTGISYDYMGENGLEDLSGFKEEGPLLTKDQTLSGRIALLENWKSDFIKNSNNSSLASLEENIRTHTNNIGIINGIFTNNLDEGSYESIFEDNKNLSSAIGNLTDLASTIHTTIKKQNSEYGDLIQIKDISSSIQLLCTEFLNPFVEEIKSELNDATSAIGKNLGDIAKLEETVYGTTVGVPVIGLTTKVQQNTDAINILNGVVGVEGSVANSINILQTSVNQSLANTNEKVDKNTEAITKLNSDINTEGSVDYKVNQQVEPLDERVGDIETTLNDESNGLVKKVNDNITSINNLTETIGDDSKGLIQKVNLNASAATSNGQNITALTNRLNQIIYNDTTDTVENVIAALAARITALEGNNS